MCFREHKSFKIKINLFPTVYNELILFSVQIAALKVLDSHVSLVLPRGNLNFLNIVLVVPVWCCLPKDVHLIIYCEYCLLSVVKQPAFAMSEKKRCYNIIISLCKHWKFDIHWYLMYLTIHSIRFTYELV